ncbi:hypothetical protein E4U41_001841 [Claviceps citrina]|nr:hypothetical protein E4U41_001841 [Claviceps citrina]
MAQDKRRRQSRSASARRSSSSQTATPPLPDQQAQQHVARFNAELERLRAHYQNGRYAYFPQAAQGRLVEDAEAARETALQHHHHQQQQLQQMQVRRSRPAARSASSGFLDALGSYIHNPRRRQQQQQQGPRGGAVDLRQHAVYAHLPARMREAFERRAERRDRAAMEAAMEEERARFEEERARREELEAAEYRWRYHNLTKRRMERRDGIEEVEVEEVGNGDGRKTRR